MRAGRSQVKSPRGGLAWGAQEPTGQADFLGQRPQPGQGSQPKCCHCKWWGPYCPFWKAEQPPKAPACKCFEPREDEIVSLAWLEGEER